MLCYHFVRDRNIFNCTRRADTSDSQKTIQFAANTRVKLALTSLEAVFHLIISQKPHYFKFSRSVPPAYVNLNR